MKRFIMMCSVVVGFSLSGLATAHAADNAPVPALASKDVSCECDQLSCNECETQTGTTFYSEKCGPSGSRVKSCKRPTCEPVENQPVCLAKAKGEKSDAAIAKSKRKNKAD